MATNSWDLQRWIRLGLLATLTLLMACGQPLLPASQFRDQVDVAQADQVAGDAIDAGTDAIDAGTDAIDAGTDAIDAGDDAVDAGSDAVDAGSDAIDAGDDAVDAEDDAVDGGTDAIDQDGDAVDAGSDALDAGSDALDAGSDGSDQDGDAIDAGSDASDQDGDAIDAGTDADVAPPECTAASDCVATQPALAVCTFYACTAGSCVVSKTAAGASCSDGNACTLGDLCDGNGTCAPGAAKVCVGDVCNEGVCDPSTGTCGKKAANESQPCDDGNGCTTQDRCQSGTCVAGGQLSCTATACNTASCDSKTGQCKQTPVADASPCDDGAPCTSGDLCYGGSCLGGKNTCTCTVGQDSACNDNNACTLDKCVTGTDGKTGCTNTVTAGVGCDDGNACTTSDGCAANGGCEGTAKVCADSDPCTLDACDPKSGCTFTLSPGTVCNDGNACTGSDACSSGGTCAGTSISCDDGKGCTDDSCAPGSGCLHANNSAACQDGNACTVDDVCSGGSCVGGAAKDCSDGVVCTDDACDAKTGCTHDNNLADCDDGDSCTAKDHCTGGTCTGKSVTCDDGKDCTTDSCDKAVGCQHADATGTCSDGSACTVGDACSKGNCVPGAAVSCDDGNACTDDSCDKTTGCLHTNNTAACTDGNECTTGDACKNGSCTGTAVADATACGASGKGNVCVAGVCSCPYGTFGSGTTATSFQDLIATPDGGVLVVGPGPNSFGSTSNPAVVEKRTAVGGYTGTATYGDYFTNMPRAITKFGPSKYMIVGYSGALTGTFGLMQTCDATGKLTTSTAYPKYGSDNGDMLQDVIGLTDGTAVAVGVNSPIVGADGSKAPASGPPYGWLVHYNADTTLKTNTKVTTQYPMQFQSVVQLHDGTIAAVGWWWPGSDGNRTAQGILALMNPEGLLLITTAPFVQVANQGTTGTSQSWLNAIAVESYSGTSTTIVAVGKVLNNGVTRPWLWRATIDANKVTAQNTSSLLSTSTGTVWGVWPGANFVSYLAGETSGPTPWYGSVKPASCTSDTCSGSLLLNSNVSGGAGVLFNSAILPWGQFATVGSKASSAYLQLVNPTNGATTCQ